MSEQRTQVSIVPDTGFINLRGDSQDADFLNAAEAATGQRLPVKANTVSEGELRVYWLGPDEWLLNPYSIRAETNLETLVHVLRASDLVRVPVVDEKDRLVGIIARRDVLRTYLSTGSSNKKRK